MREYIFWLFKGMVKIRERATFKSKLENDANKEVSHSLIGNQFLLLTIV